MATRELNLDTVADELKARDDTIDASREDEQQEPRPETPAGEPEAVGARKCDRLGRLHGLGARPVLCPLRKCPSTKAAT